MASDTMRAIPPGRTRLLPVQTQSRVQPSIFQERYKLNRAYVMSLRNENLLQNFYQEAGLWNPRSRLTDCHWGWETPTCQLRGHFLGHWLSAAARLYATNDDREARAKADQVVAELWRCQRENGGEWAGSIPPVYLDWVARRKQIWAPHYTLHKTLMGLNDMYALTGNEQALEIAVNWAKWFHRWTNQFSREQLDDILDVETGGMLEAWADLYGVTGKQEHLDLVQRYDRPRLFNRLLDGADPLTNQHANTTIPEAHGAARAWEVTGDRRWRDIAEAYWKSAVTDRGYYATGGQTCGEFWTPPHELSSRLGDKNQEFCTVYNMMRLAEILFRWTGDIQYADYWERNLYNGVLAQQHPTTGMIAYFLPFQSGAIKAWGTPTEDFWCCHGTLVQAHAMHGQAVYFENDAGLVVTQYVPTTLDWEHAGAKVKIDLTFDPQLEQTHRPGSTAYDLAISCDRPVEFTLTLRLPWWLSGEAAIVVNGERQPVVGGASTFQTIRRTWSRDKVRVVLPKTLTSEPLPDRPDTVAFLDGPVVLAGLCAEGRRLTGHADRPETILVPENEREWRTWEPGYRTVGQDREIRFVPLHEITDERYTVYFPVQGEATGK